MFYEYNHLGSPDYLKLEHDYNFNFPPHLHHCFELITLLSGEMRVTVDGTAFSLKKGDAMLIFPNQIHELESVCSEHVLCIFSPQLVQAYATKITDKVPVSNLFVPDDYLVTALQKIGSGSSIEKKGILYSLCAQFHKSAQYTPRQEDSRSLLYRIFSFVENNFGEDCSLNNLSKHLGYDYSYLSRVFKKIVGVSFNTYVNQYRLSHACYLMENTQLSIIQCAFESGYSSVRSFNRSFKVHFGLTPAQYRKRQIVS